MSKRHNTKYKTDRSLGGNIWGRPKSPFNRRSYPPGEHGALRHGQLSDYGLHLKAKQKLKKSYGDITEKQFHGIYKKATRKRGDTGEILIGLLESRLDALVYRAKFAISIFAARQFVSHGHILVNGKKTNIPSYTVKVNDIVEVKEKSKQLPILLEAIQNQERNVPSSYMEVDHEKMTAMLTRIPHLDDIPFAIEMEPNMVIEYYSR